MAEDVVVYTRGLTKAYGRRTIALRDLDLEIRRGEVFAYLGPNGAGKTTTLRLLTGMLRPTAGTAEVLGLDAWRESVAVHRRVGYLPGDPALYDRLTGRDHIAYLSSLRGDRSAANARALAGRLELDLTRPARALSRGNKQKLAVVLALMSRPELLILDEPTSGLDPLIQEVFQDLLRDHVSAGGTVLLSSHVLSEVQRVADRIGVVKAGRLIAVERLDDLRRESLHHVTARFSAPVDASQFRNLPGVRHVTTENGTMTCQAPQAALDPLLKEVSRHPVLDFECAEAELEETFMAYYREDAGHVG